MLASDVAEYVERQDWARRTGQGARRSRTGGGCAVGTAGGWHARRVKAGALRRHGGVSGPGVHYACLCEGGRGPRPGGIAHARQPAGCTVVPQGLPFGGAPAREGRGGQLARSPWWAAAAASGGPDGRRRSCSRGKLTSRRRGVERPATDGGLTSRRQKAGWPVGKVVLRVTGRG